MSIISERFIHQLQRIVLLNHCELKMRHDDHNAVVWNHFRHTVEEVGEMACALRGRNDEPLANEAVDTAICALAVALLENGGEVEAITEVMEQKLDKWQRRVEKELP